MIEEDCGSAHVVSSYALGAAANRLGMQHWVVLAAPEELVDNATVDGEFVQRNSLGEADLLRENGIMMFQQSNSKYVVGDVYAYTEQPQTSAM